MKLCFSISSAETRFRGSVCSNRPIRERASTLTPPGIWNFPDFTRLSISLTPLSCKRGGMEKTEINLTSRTLDLTIGPDMPMLLIVIMNSVIF